MGVIPGVDFNTFSIVGRCSRTGMLGIAIRGSGQNTNPSFVCVATCLDR